MTKQIVMWVVRRLFELWVLVSAIEIIYGLVAIWVILDGSGELMVMADFVFAALLAWLLLVTGFLSQYTFRSPIHPRLAQVYLLSYSLTWLMVVIYCFRPIGYLHAPIQREVYDMFLTPIRYREVMLILSMLGLGIATLPQLLCCCYRQAACSPKCRMHCVRCQSVCVQIDHQS